MEFLISCIPPALVGVFIGTFSGLLGIGGGTIMVPVFRLAFGLSPLMSTGTSLFTIIPTSLSGAISHIRNKTCYLPLGIALGFGGACTSPIGVWLSTISPPLLVMFAAALIIGYSMINMLKKAIALGPSARKNSAPSSFAEIAPEKKTKDTMKSHALVDSFLDPDETGNNKESRSSSETLVAFGKVEDQSFELEPKLTKKQLVIGFFIGAMAGMAAGYIGVGGGFIMVPFMISVLHIPMKKASGTSLIAMIILAVPGVVQQALFGNISYMTGIATAIGSIPGAFLGANLVRVVPERTLRFVFACFLMVSAVMLVLNEFHILG